MTQREKIHAAVGRVLANASNYPEKVQSRILGQDTFPLTEAVVDSLVAAGVVWTEQQTPTDRPDTDAVAASMLASLDRLLDRKPLGPFDRGAVSAALKTAARDGYALGTTAKHAALVSEVETLTTQRDAARQQSIEWETWGAGHEATAARVLALLEPIIETGKGHMGTHSDHCHVYHAGCLAVRMRDLLTADGPTSDSSSTGSQS